MTARRKRRKVKRKPTQIVRSISRFAGTLVGTTVDIGKKAPGVRAFLKIRNLAATLESELDATNHKLAVLTAANSKLVKSKETARRVQSQLSSQVKVLQAG
ncbi:MAG: hypothetical protein ACYS71_02055, partial [Planctomycetota bacterium]